MPQSNLLLKSAEPLGFIMKENHLSACIFLYSTQENLTTWKQKVSKK